MKANIENLENAMRLSADAHKVKMSHWRDDFQIALNSDSVPVCADVKMIAESFLTNPAIYVEWGYTTIDYGVCEFKDEVDIDILQMALPSGSIVDDNFV